MPPWGSVPSTDPILVLNSTLTIAPFLLFKSLPGPSNNPKNLQHNTLPEMKKLHAKYGREGLVVIGVRTPEFLYERKRENVERAVASTGLTYPIAPDSNNTTWKLYGSHYWPRQTIIDRKGEVAYEHVGEGGYREIEAKVVELLKWAAPKTPRTGRPPR